MDLVIYVTRRAVVGYGTRAPSSTERATHPTRLRTCVFRHLPMSSRAVPRSLRGAVFWYKSSHCQGWLRLLKISALLLPRMRFVSCIVIVRPSFDCPIIRTVRTVRSLYSLDTCSVTDVEPGTKLTTSDKLLTLTTLQILAIDALARWLPSSVPFLCVLCDSYLCYFP